MAIQVNGVISRVKAIFGDEAGIQVTDAKIKDWIVDALNEISNQDANLAQGMESGTLVAGVNKLPGPVSLPLDLMDLQSLYVKNKKVPYFTPQQLDQAGIDWYSGSDHQRGVPIAWTRMGMDIYLFPTPDEAMPYRMLYSKALIWDQVDTVIPVPTYYNNCIVEYCLMKAYEMDEDWEAVAAKASIVQGMIDYNSLRHTHFGKDFFPTISEVD